jgi:hypothetical protein
MQLDHRERQRWVAEIGAINQRMNQAVAEQKGVRR